MHQGAPGWGCFRAPQLHTAVLVLLVEDNVRARMCHRAPPSSASPAAPQALTRPPLPRPRLPQGQEATKFVFQGVHETICFGPAAAGWQAGETPLNQIVFIGRDLNRRVSLPAARSPAAAAVPEAGSWPAGPSRNVAGPSPEELPCCRPPVTTFPS